MNFFARLKFFKKESQEISFAAKASGPRSPIV
jgi:hypothetical protein